MIILDTNVVSELAKLAPNPLVLQRLDRLHRPSVFITSITQAELLLGLELLPNGKRKSRLETEIFRLIVNVLHSRVIGFDANAAIEFARIAAVRQVAGKPISFADAQIAAIAKLHGAVLATRNVRDFLGLGFTVWNPWEQEDPQEHHG